MNPAKGKMIDLLKEKAGTKQDVYINTLEMFQKIKRKLKKIQKDLISEMAKIDKSVEINYEDKGSFEVNFTFGGDLLILTMHSNVFTFNQDHFIYKTKYVQEDNSRAYCGIINMYNFLKDSIKYKRSNDVGYLIGRIFINRELHFFVEGKRQLGFLYNDFNTNIFNDENMSAILESAIIYCLEFDLLTPPFNSASEMTVSEKLRQSGILSIKTGKRLGFKFQADQDKIH